MAPPFKATPSEVAKKQSKISAFGKISKIAPAVVGNKACLTKVAPAAEATEPTVPCLGAGKKRRYDALDDEEGCKSKEQFTHSLSKKPRIQPPPSDTSSQTTVDGTPSPVSSHSSYTSHGSISRPEEVAAKPVTAANLPSTLKSILALHGNFLKALSIHFAHNGWSTPAELGSLLKTVTCLWKKHAVKKDDIQRMLALYEVSSKKDGSVALQPGTTISHKECPFQLTSSGAAGNMRVCVEYFGARDVEVKESMRSPFSEKDLQYLFELDVLCLYRASKNKLNTHLSFLSGPLAEFPLLSCTIGTQSAARQEKASARRTEMLSLSNASQQRQQIRPVTRADPVPETTNKTDNEITEAVKSRTKSLFDRIAERQALKLSSSTPTAASILRRRAIGRIGDIVEILRLKQHQKSVGRNYLLPNSCTTSPTNMGQRVSFSMKQLQIEIRDSANVPIGDEEIKICLEVLAKEGATRNWLKILDSGVGERMSNFVVLEGSGMPGTDVQKALQDQVV